VCVKKDYDVLESCDGHHLPGAGFASFGGANTVVVVVTILLTYRTVEGYAATDTN
jgi:hypothetical protein